MLISDLAARELGWQSEAIRLGLGSLVGRLRRCFVKRQQQPAALTTADPPKPLTTEEPSGEPAARAAVASVAPASDEALRWRRHPQLRDRSAVMCGPEHQARLAAIRGVFNARAGDYEGARLAFAQAAREDVIDLAEVPSFWCMPRAGLTAAVLGYEDAGRLRDAAALAARIRIDLRPRLLAAIPAAERNGQPPRHRLTASGE